MASSKDLIRASASGFVKEAGPTGWLAQRAGNAVGILGILPAMLVGAPAAAAGLGAAKAAGGATRMVGRAFAKQPIGTAAGLGFLGLTGPHSLSGLSPEVKERHRQIIAEQAASAQPRWGRTVTASVKYSVDELRQLQKIASVLEKRSAKVPGSGASSIARALLLATAVAPVIGAAASVGMHATGKATELLRSFGSEKRYKEMLTADPTLKSEPRSRQFFNILDRASPYISSEPVVAAATVRNMIETPSLHSQGVQAITPKMVSEILNVEKARQETRFPAFGIGKHVAAPTRIPEIE